MRRYIVTYRKSAVVTELVEARTAAEAIEAAKRGEGDRIGFEIDETRWPTAYSARRDRDRSGDQS